MSEKSDWLRELSPMDPREQFAGERGEAFNRAFFDDAERSVGGILRTLKHYEQNNVKYRQTSLSTSPTKEGYEYVEIPLWALRQMIEALSK